VIEDLKAKNDENTHTIADLTKKLAETHEELTRLEV
jgi:uncharacterized protein involved in exopolysaccharide biosynthesis